MEYLQDVLKKNGWSSIVTSFILSVVGVILISNPDIAVKTVSYVIGILFFCFGIFKIISYWKERGRYNYYNYDLAYGIISIIFGIIVIIYSSQIVSLFRILIGIWIIYSAILRINFSYKLKTMDQYIWKNSLVISLLILACGLWVILTSNSLIRIMGIGILVYSILDIIEGFIFLKNVDKMV